MPSGARARLLEGRWNPTAELLKAAPDIAKTAPNCLILTDGTNQSRLERDPFRDAPPSPVVRAHVCLIRSARSSGSATPSSCLALYATLVSSG